MKHVGIQDHDPLSAYSFFAGKRVVVTGGAGSVGAELVAQLLAMPVELVRVVDNNESALFDLAEQYRGEHRLQTFCCDIRDEHELNRTFSGMQLCFHAAALKHVPSCEHSPFSAIQTNIIGTQHVIRAALLNHLTHALFTSSDKAVNPTNVMGTSKLMGERLFTAANSLSEGKNRCLFSSTRFGNVAGSRGSVIPLFCDQIAGGRDITLTHPEMTRFMMTLENAAKLVIDTMPLSRGGEIFVTKMPVIAIRDLAHTLVEMVAPLAHRSPAQIRIKEIGPRPGEKMWEELNTDEEVRRTYDLGDYLVILPALRNFHADVDYRYGDRALRPVDKIYHSANQAKISEAELQALLLEPGVLPAEIRRQLASLEHAA